MLSGTGRIFAAGSDKIRVGLIGCGGQGTRDIISCVKSSPGVELVAMGDLFKDRLRQSLDKLTKDVPAAVKVRSGKRFVGFDAYKRVLQTDVHLVLLTAPPHWRAEHFQAAVEAGKHVFMEKPGGGWTRRGFVQLSRRRSSLGESAYRWLRARSADTARNTKRLSGGSMTVKLER